MSVPDPLPMFDEWDEPVFIIFATDTSIHADYLSRGQPRAVPPGALCTDAARRSMDLMREDSELPERCVTGSDLSKARGRQMSVGHSRLARCKHALASQVRLIGRHVFH
jgi:hypothetical protein